MQEYMLITALETEAEQRRSDPRILAAEGYPIPRRRAVRQRIGTWLVSLGTMLVGPSSTFDRESAFSLVEPG